jgi:hypothetical protein
VVDPPVLRLEALLGPPRAIERLTPEAVLQLCSEFPVRNLAEEVRILAARFARAETERRPEGDRRLAWHHLLMAVANLKSRGANVHPGGTECFLDDVDDVGIESFRLPVPTLRSSSAADRGEESPVVAVEDPDSWQSLMEAVQGLTVTTTTTLLAALWPHTHAILDNLDAGTVMGLQALDGRGKPWGDVTVAGLNSMWRDVVTGTKTWPDYEWFRGTLHKTVEQPGFNSRSVGLLDVERSLYLIGGRAAGYNATQWSEWDLRLTDILEMATATWRDRSARSPSGPFGLPTRDSTT